MGSAISFILGFILPLGYLIKICLFLIISIFGFIICIIEGKNAVFPFMFLSMFGLLCSFPKKDRKKDIKKD